MDNKTVKIIVATYNGEKYLREQMDSLLNQSYENLQIEVCDDGSTDRTMEIVREYQAKDERVTAHVNQENRGYVRNFLEAIRRSTQPYIMLCDQDDIWDPDKVEITLDKMQQKEKQCPGKPILVYTDAINFDSEKKERLGRFHQNSHLDTKKVDTAHLFMENKVIGCTVMVNAQIIPYLGECPKEIRVHDWWLAMLCSHFGQIVYVDRPTLLYRQHSGNQIGGSSFGSYVKDRLSGLRRQRQALQSSYRQGRAFLELYGDRMEDDQRAIAKAFAKMEHAGWFLRRYYMCRYGFTKSGLIRNIGLFLVI